MGNIFRVFAKLVGIAWTAYSLAVILGTGFILLAPGPRSESLAGEVAYRFMVCIALLIQLGLAVSLMLGTDNWASFLGVPSDSQDFTVSSEDAITVGTKLIGVYYLVQAVPDFVSECLAILQPAAEPVGGVVDVLPLVRPGATVLLGCLCAFGTASLVRLVTENRNVGAEENA